MSLLNIAFQRVAALAHEVRRIVSNAGWKTCLLLAASSLLGLLGLRALLYHRGWMPMQDLRGKHILLTGAAGGLGNYFCQILGQKGCKLSLIDIRKEELQSLERKLQQRGFQCQVHFVNLLCEEEVRGCVERCQQKFGPIDVLINNAGVCTSGVFWNCPKQTFSRIIDTNFMSIYHLTKQVLQKMLPRDCGTILDISSVAGLHGMKLHSAYSASKSALRGFNQTLRQELRESGSRVKAKIVHLYYVRAGIGLQYVQPKWYQPVMEAEWACRRVVLMLEQDEPQLVLPWRLNLLPTLKSIAPGWVTDRLMRLIEIG